MLRPPRPLRSAETPTGLPDVTPKEFAQLVVGNSILLLALTLFFLVLRTGGCGIVEHPADPIGRFEGVPSIFRLDLVNTLKNLGARVIYLDQCRYGARSKKPTMILTSNAEWLWDISLANGTHQLPCVCTAPHELLLSGVGEDGQFRTAAAKSYPSGLCFLFATAIVKAAVLRQSRGKLIDNFDLWESDQTHSEFQYYFPLDPFANGEGYFDAVGFAPDFHARDDMSY